MVRKRMIGIVLMGLFCGGFVLLNLASAKPAAGLHPAKPPTAQDDPSFPSPKKDNGTFLKMHESFLKRDKQGPIGVLFLGDSITQGWNGAGKEVWTKSFSKYHPANFGIGGDRTQHVLWRITNGELDGISPKVVVLMIGTNNIHSDSAEAIAAADVKIVKTIQEKLPKTKVLVLGIFPRSHKSDIPATKIPEKVKAVNAELAKLDDGKSVRFLDMGEKLAPEGKATPPIYTDGVHLAAKGYQIWADAIGSMLKEMMK